MAEQEVTYTVEKEKTETVTVCDGCGVEVEPGENCRTVTDLDDMDLQDSWKVELTSVDEYEYFDRFDEDFFVLKPDDVMGSLDDGLIVPRSALPLTSEDPFHYCFDCWDGVNLSVDEKSLSMSESYSDKVMSRAKDELREDLKEQSVIKKLGYASNEDLVIAAFMIVGTAVSVAFTIQDIAFIPVAVVVSILTILSVNDLLQVRL